jgi:hypothetical protein
LPTLYAAASPAAVGRGYYGPQGFLEIRGATVGNAKVSPQANDLAAATRLWQVCEAASGQHLLSGVGVGAGAGGVGVGDDEAGTGIA